LEPVLAAAHIIPVKAKGRDVIENGVCLRSDIHMLFDTGHLRIDTSGRIHLSEDAAHENNYSRLPRMVEIPAFVNKDYIDWRWNYY
jgi:predicted restriction endonuclease